VRLRLLILKPPSMASTVDGGGKRRILRESALANELEKPALDALVIVDQDDRSKGLKGHWLECEICQELDC
jgi:hypothetical protein